MNLRITRRSGNGSRKKFAEHDVAFLRALAHLLGLALERREMLAELAVSEAHLTMLLTQLPAIVWSVGLDLTIDFIAGSALDRLTFGREQLVGVSVAEVFLATGWGPMAGGSSGGLDRARSHRRGPVRRADVAGAARAAPGARRPDDGRPRDGGGCLRSGGRPELGHTHAEIAATLSVSVRTVETHRASAAHKLGAQTRADLVAAAIDLRRVDFTGEL